MSTGAVGLAPVALAGDESGSGAPLVLVHGLCGSRRVWDDVVTDLAASYRVLRVDLRGHGETGGPARAGAYTVAAAAADLADTVTARGLPHPVVVAHSFGGTVALWAALAHQRLFGALVLVGSFALGVAPERRRVLRRQFRELERVGVRRYWDGHEADRVNDPGLGARFRSDDEFGRVRRDEALAVVAEACTGFGRELVSAPSFAPWLWQLDLPVALLVGELDTAMLPAMRLLGDVLPDAVLTVLPGCGHNPMMEDPPRFLANLQRAISTTLH